MKKNSDKIALCLLILFLSVATSAMGEEIVPLRTEMDELSLYMGADQLVETTSRNPKPLSQVAENVTVITAEQIEAMNAHTVAEVLNRVPGIIMDGSYKDFGSSSTIFIQGADYEHVLVLVDGVRWSYVSFDYPETNTIPVQIIKRIEVVKGPASSTWGSSLGGVVNIITKDTGNTTLPNGTLSGSYGESNTSDLRVDAAGKAGPLGYYLYAGRQESDGLRDSRFFENQSFYGKFHLPLPRKMELQVSFGYSRPDYKYYSLPDWDDQGVNNDRAFHAALDLFAPLGNNFTANFSAYKFEDTFTDSWQLISSSAPYNQLEYDGTSTGATGRLAWTGDMQTLVLGAEIERRENTTSDLLASYSAPTTHEEVWAVFVNDTIRFGNLTFTPGLRYDHLSIADEEINPSLGIIYQVSDTTLLRGNISRGFRKPYPSLIQGDPNFDIINPALKSETIWSCQLGVETTAIPFLYLKTTLFDHEASDVWVTDPDTWAIVNNGDYERQGVEVSLQTVSFHNLSLGVNGMYVRMKPDLQSHDDHLTGNFFLEYNDNVWKGQLFGHYLKLGNVDPPTAYEKKTDTIIWDMVVQRKISVSKGLQSDIFVVLHNITNEDQYAQSPFPNSPRWVEAGVRIKF